MPTPDQQPSRAKRVGAAAAIAAAIIAPAEGLRQYVYIDPVGIPTYCFGETRNPEPGRAYTVDECKSLLNDRALAAVDVIEKCVPGLPTNVLGAFASAVYNMGPTIACNVHQSKAAALLRAGQFVAACNQLPNWVKARVGGVLITLPGLVKRREAERQVCLSGLDKA